MWNSPVPGKRRAWSFGELTSNPQRIPMTDATDEGHLWGLARYRLKEIWKQRQSVIWEDLSQLGFGSWHSPISPVEVRCEQFYNKIYDLIPTVSNLVFKGIIRYWENLVSRSSWALHNREQLVNTPPAKPRLASWARLHLLLKIVYGVACQEL